MQSRTNDRGDRSDTSLPPPLRCALVAQASASIAAYVLAGVPTALRLVLAGAFPVLEGSWRVGALGLAGASDVVDGFIARRLHATTWGGALLDAIADKTLAGVVLATFAFEGMLDPRWLPLLLARDLTVATIYVYIAARGGWSEFRRVQPRPLGKATTFALFAFMLALAAEWRSAAMLLRWPAVLISMAAAADYAGTFARALRRRSS